MLIVTNDTIFIIIIEASCDLCWIFAIFDFFSHFFVFGPIWLKIRNRTPQPLVFDEFARMFEVHPQTKVFSVNL
jgi:hypothetical protein